MGADPPASKADLLFINEFPSSKSMGMGGCGLASAISDTLRHISLTDLAVGWVGKCMCKRGAVTIKQGEKKSEKMLANPHWTLQITVSPVVHIHSHTNRPKLSRFSQEKGELAWLDLQTTG